MAHCGAAPPTAACISSLLAKWGCGRATAHHGREGHTSGGGWWRRCAATPAPHLSSSSALCFCCSRFSVNLRRSSSARARCSGVPALGSHTQVWRPTLSFRLCSRGWPSWSEAVLNTHIPPMQGLLRPRAPQSRRHSLDQSRGLTPEALPAVAASKNWAEITGNNAIGAIARSHSSDAAPHSTRRYRCAAATC